MVANKVQSKWIQSAGDEHAVRNGCTFDERAGMHVVEFFRRYLRHSKDPWAGKSFELFPEQRDKIIMPLFGWKRADGTRRFRIGYISVAKKNFKSTMNAGLSLYMLTADGEQGAGVYCAAADRAQASIVFDEAFPICFLDQILALFPVK